MHNILSMRVSMDRIGENMGSFYEQWVIDGFFLIIIFNIVCTVV
jgi:hypothetical protein